MRDVIFVVCLEGKSIMKGKENLVLSVRMSQDLRVAYNREFTVHFIVNLGSVPMIKSQLLIVIGQQTTFQINVWPTFSHTMSLYATMQGSTNSSTKLEERHTVNLGSEMV